MTGSGGPSWPPRPGIHARASSSSPKALKASRSTAPSRSCAASRASQDWEGGRCWRLVRGGRGGNRSGSPVLLVVATVLLLLLPLPLLPLGLLPPGAALPAVVLVPLLLLLLVAAAVEGEGAAAAGASRLHRGACCQQRPAHLLHVLLLDSAAWLVLHCQSPPWMCWVGSAGPPARRSAGRRALNSLVDTKRRDLSSEQQSPARGGRALPRATARMS